MCTAEGKLSPQIEAPRSFHKAAALMLRLLYEGVVSIFVEIKHMRSKVLIFALLEVLKG